MNFLGGNIFWMNWHFNFKQCRLFNSRSISTIESPLRSWRFPFSQLFFSLFLGGQSALQDSKKVRFWGEPEEAGPMKWSKRFPKSCKPTILRLGRRRSWYQSILVLPSTKAHMTPWLSPASREAWTWASPSSSTLSWGGDVWKSG